MAMGGAKAAQLDRIVVPEDADGFLAAHPRMAGSFHRTALGSTATKVTSADTGVIRTTSTHFGFPVMGELCLGSAFVGCGVIAESGGPLRWRGEEGTAGEAVLFTADVRVPVILPSDTTVLTVSAPVDPVEEASDVLGIRIGTEGAQIVGGPPLALLGRAIRRHHESVGSDRHDDIVDDEILRGLVHVLSSRDALNESRARGESARVVTRVLDVLEGERRWRLSTLQMCRLTHVSERRLQMAFHDMYDVSPTTFLRQRALSSCRDALLRADPSETSVSAVALDHGFQHLSRFASVYRATFGELPSETLSRLR